MLGAAAGAIDAAAARPASTEFRLRLSPLAAGLVFALGLVASTARAQDASLPDIGSSAGELLSPEEEVQYGAYTFYGLRRAGYVQPNWRPGEFDRRVDRVR